MTFTTPQFVFTLIAVLICWYIIPRKLKKPALLLFSYYYAYLLGGVWSVIVLFCITLLTYFCGLLLVRSSRKKLILSGFTWALVLLLVYGRQSSFLQEIIAKFTGSEGISWTVVSMVGLSYYVLSAISYITDIYRGKDEPDSSPADLALWLAYFPKITAGPIERHGAFKAELEGIPARKFDFERIKRGLLICARGYFYKIIIADRIAFLVDTVFPDAVNHYGFTLAVTMILYSLEIYFDFAGYSLIAFGMSHAMGLKITNNFDHPYFSASVTEFWRRWHISLSSWLRDYIYIPLGGNRKGKFRQYINLAVTFIVSGLWHGAGITFMIWGALHAAYQIFEKLVWSRIRIPAFLNRVITFLMVSFAWIFFRADSLRTAKIFIKRMLMRWNPQVLTDGTLTGLGIDVKDWCVLLPALAIALAAEILEYRGISLYEKLEKNHLVIRWAVYYLIIVILLVFGIYGTSYDASSFIYFRF